MAWMLDAAGIESGGLRGALRVRGLCAIWLWTMRAWQADASPDLSATMAALDNALTRAAPAANWLNGAPAAPPEPASGPTAAAGDSEENR
jgi:ubiquinone biosynthesis protein COQ9